MLTFIVVKKASEEGANGSFRPKTDIAGRSLETGRGYYG